MTTGGDGPATGQEVTVQRHVFNRAVHPPSGSLFLRAASGARER